jgi:hypothetical protein
MLHKLKQFGVRVVCGLCLLLIGMTWHHFALVETSALGQQDTAPTAIPWDQLPDCPESFYTPQPATEPTPLPNDDAPQCRLHGEFTDFTEYLNNGGDPSAIGLSIDPPPATPHAVGTPLIDELTSSQSLNTENEHLYLPAIKR